MEYHSYKLGIKRRCEASVLDNLYSTEGLKTMFRKEVERLVGLRVFEEANDSEWGATLFAQPKEKLIVSDS